MAIARLGWDAEEPTFRRLTIQAVVPDIGPADADWLDRYLRQTIDARASVALIEAIGDFDHRGTLGALATPTLVLHAQGDLAVPLEHGRNLADLVPDARFVQVASRNNAFSQLDPGWKDTLDTAMAFLKGAWAMRRHRAKPRGCSPPPPRSGR